MIILPGAYGLGVSGSRPERGGGPAALTDNYETLSASRQELWNYYKLAFG